MVRFLGLVGALLACLVASEVPAADLWLPVRGALVSGYGWRDDPFGEGWHFHSGVDVAAPEGAPVAARADGGVEYAGWASAYGLVVVLAHGSDYQTLYAHLRRIRVQRGDRVRAGQLVGEVGSTGRSTGPHLHFEVRYRGVPVDPIPYLRR
ncbi:Murein hydrolase activator NlpD [bacterium HR32]|nr:Murein hydrolase activator NlpD [bacterium HR32]